MSHGLRDQGTVFYVSLFVFFVSLRVVFFVSLPCVLREPIRVLREP